jgi:type IV pilus assembly protein PilA
MKNYYGRKGFTLVEIMIVVVIIGMLCAMAIPTFNAVRTHSRNSTILNNLRQIAAASQQYMLEKGSASCSYTDLVGTGTDNYLHSVSPVADEDYSIITVAQTQTQVSVAGTTVGTLTYNL